MGLLLTLVSGGQAPRRSPEFVINMSNGSPLLLSQYDGKVIVLAFLYTT